MYPKINSNVILCGIIGSRPTPRLSFQGDKTNAIVGWVEGISVLDLSRLVKHLEERLEISTNTNLPQEASYAPRKARQAISSGYSLSPRDYGQLRTLAKSRQTR